MNVPSINAYIYGCKSYKTPKNTTSFCRDWDPPTPDCFKTDPKVLYNRYGAYEALITYKEILAMKEIAEKSKNEYYIPNIIVAFYPNSLGYGVYAMSQDDADKGFDGMKDITDFDSY